MTDPIQRPSVALKAMQAANDFRSTLFARLIGLALLAFGLFLLYKATAMAQTLTGAVVAAAALALMLPAQVQTAGAILIGIGRSAGLIKTKPTHHHAKSTLGETVSARVEDLPDIPKRKP